MRMREFCNSAYFCILLSCCVTPQPTVWCFMNLFVSFTIRSNFSIQTLLARSSKRDSLDPNALLEKVLVPKSNSKTTCRRDWSIRVLQNIWMVNAPSPKITGCCHLIFNRGLGNVSYSFRTLMVIDDQNIQLNGQKLCLSLPSRIYNVK